MSQGRGRTLSLPTILLTVFSSLLGPGMASAAPVHLDGGLVFWQRPVCTSGLQCLPPQPIAKPIAVSLQFERPEGPGAHLVVNTTFSSAAPPPLTVSTATESSAQSTGESPAAPAQSTGEVWSVELSIVWVNPPLDPSGGPSSAESSASSASTHPYLVTQLRLSEKAMGVVAECSRYDGVDAFHFLMPGACSGRNGPTMYGVSTLSSAELARSDMR